MENDENTTIWKTTQFSENIEGMRGFSRIPSRFQNIKKAVPKPKPVPTPIPKVQSPPPPPPKPDEFSAPLPKMNASIPQTYTQTPYTVPSSPLIQTKSQTETLGVDKKIMPVNNNLQDSSNKSSPLPKKISISKELPKKATFSKPTTTNEGLDTLHIKNPPFVDRRDFAPRIVALDTATAETKLFKKEDPTPEAEIKYKKETSENPFLEKIIDSTPQEYATEDNNIQERLKNLLFGVDFSNFDMNQFRNLIYRIFNFFPELADIGLYAISYKIVRLFYSKETVFAEKHSSPNKYEADIRTLKLQLYAFLAIPFSYLIGYNLWYLFTTVYPYKKIGKIVDSNSILKYIFETSFAPTVALNYALFGYKQGSGKFMSETAYSAMKPFMSIIAVLFFIIVYFYVKNNCASIRNLFNNVLKNPTTTKDPIYSVFFFMVMVSFIGINVFNMKEDMPFVGMMLSFMSPITTIVLLLVKMVIVLLTVPIGMLVLIIYLVIFSTIGIALYSGFSNFFGTIRGIDVEIQNSIPKPQGSCAEEGIFMKIMRWINSHSYGYLTFFILAIVIISNMSSVFTEIHSLKLKTMLIGIYAIMATIYAMVMFWKIYKEYI